MQEVDDKKLSDLSKRFLQAISYCGLSGYKLKKDNIISSESTLTSIKKGIQNVSKMLGHTNVRTTQQYAIVLNAEVEKDFEMLERILS